MTCNLVGGMIQRLDGLRKVGFGSLIIFGEDSNSSISGVWVFRGQQLAFEVNKQDNATQMQNFSKSVL